LVVLSILLALAALPGCETQARPPYLIRLIDGQGVNPVPDLEANLTVTVLQSGVPATSPVTTPIIDGTFSLDVPIVDYGLNTALSARIAPVGDSSLIGATVPFGPIGFPNGIHVVMGRPGTCVPLTAPRLDGARLLPGLVLMRADVVGIGGERSGGAVRSVDVFSPLNLGTDFHSGSVGTLASAGFARTRAAPIDTSLLLAIDGGHAVVYDAGAGDATTRRDTEVTLHGGANILSALAELGGDGVAVVGGRIDGGEAVPNITVVRGIDAFDRSHMLAFARSGASAARFGRGILVAGGQAEGEPLFEWISIDGSANVSFGEGEPPRTGGALVVSPGGASAFYYLGRASDESLVDTTYLISGCPAACVATRADPAAHPRFEPATARRAAATVVIGGFDLATEASATVEEVRFVGSSVTVVQLGDLSSARADTAAVTLGGGTVLVAGGQGRGGPLDTMELCFPEELDPLVVPESP
jgi:hypothetical protein